MPATEMDEIVTGHEPAAASATSPADSLPTNPDKLDTVYETAEVFNCSPATVWRMVADGRIPKPIKIGGMTRFSRKENLAVIEKAKEERTAA